MMMNRFDLGGCCLAQYGSATPYFASKTDQIMSRYRPIAPKPVTQSSGGVADGVPHQQQQPLPPPVENRGIRTCNRTRKRSWDSAAAGGGVVSSQSPRGHKRAARSRASGASEAPSSNSEGPPPQSRLEKSTTKSSVVLGGSSQTSLRPHSDTSGGSGGGGGGGGGLTLCEISDSAASKNFGLGLPSLGYSSSSCTSVDSSLVTHKTEVLLEKDAAFMERAAASASPHVGLPERKPTNSHTQMDLVTLPLLPAAPSPSKSSPKDTIHHDSQSPKKIMADISVLERVYSAASDPVILTDDSAAHRVMWYNSAYRRLVSAAEVGVPTPLASFKQPFASTAAILWGFSKKYGAESKKGGGGGVIMPQPMRPVGSSVVVECITDTNVEAFPFGGAAVHVVEEQLELQTAPCLISDSNNRVRWANSAYKQMIGQPECSWLDSDHTKKAVKVSRIHGEVVLVFNLERFRLQEPLAAFSCRVKIQWTNGGEKSSMTVPCDVVKINGNSVSYAWQFDIQAALSL